MTTIGIIILITTIIQEYICWMTYKNWFDNEIKHMKMIGSDSLIAMVWSLTLFVWIVSNFNEKQ